MANGFLVIGTILMLIEHIESILVGRVIYGIGCGIFSVFVPKFSKTLLSKQALVNETTPVELRGVLGVMT